MPARVRTAAILGIDAVSVEVEVDVLPGLPAFTVVGLGDRSIQESRERLVAALTNVGYVPPRRKTIVSLAPASLKKEGSMYDLPIAIGFLLASGQLKPAKPADGGPAWQEAWFIGEVGLDGTIRSVRGVLPVVLAARRAGVKAVYVPTGNVGEVGAVADHVAIYPVASLQQLVGHLEAKESLLPLSVQVVTDAWTEPAVDMAEIKGQEHAKRALTIAAAAHHNVLLVGPPGTGKTLLARALAGILPPLSDEESLTVTSLYSIAGLLPPGGGLITQRPFRHPHYGASSVALIGGGGFPRPGEVSLAHAGVLFLDELPEFPRAVLDQLRQPIEDGIVTVARSAQTISFPARSMLVGAMNPCKCGFIGSTRKACQCPVADVLRYQRRVSGPLLDRFDVHVAVPDVPLEEILSPEARGMSSRDVGEQVRQARDRQLARQGKPNSELTGRELRRHGAVGKLSTKLLYQAEEKFHLSARGVHRLLKVARTIADLQGAETISPRHMAEALQYREQLQQYLPDFV